VAHRWKRVFGERGSLRLRDGHLVLVRGVHESPFSQFSSGEKVVAAGDPAAGARCLDAGVVPLAG
jgi:hypothetical protein